MKPIKLMLEYSKNLDVLYVEDDIELLETSTELFSCYFKSVDTAKDGEEGLEKYMAYKEKNDTYYDLILTDINMPKMDGIAMSEKILDINHMQSIIIITAYNETQYLTKAIELGINGFITKPIDNNHLVTVLYKISQAISDHKFVESHVELMENLNIQLEEQNQELMKKNSELEKSFRLLNTITEKEKMTTPKTINTQKTVIDESQRQQIEDLVTNDLFELKEILTEIDVEVIEILNSITQVSHESIMRLSALFSQYASVLHLYSFFNELSTNMSNFATTIRDNPLPDKQESITNIFMLLESFLYVLNKWQINISSGDSDILNQFDASIISDIATITNMWVEKDYSQDKVDAIFDF